VRLTVETGPLAGTVVSLDRAQPTTLGSAPECALRVQEAGVAPQQAVVKALREQGFGIKALANGLRVNGAAVEASPLKDGDIIEIGTTRIAFGQVQKRGLPTITGYRVLEEVGRGGMGYVYRAEQTSLHREVALKVLNRELTKDPAFVAKFVAEARAAAKLQHPHVVQVFDVDQDGETYFYTMELMHDGSLEDWLKQHGAMPSDRALRVVADAAEGLAYAESLGIVHRDIKPDNLMLDQHGAVKIADLGLAIAVEETEDKAIGTPHFMAPEQVLNKEIDHRTDLYALGCTFYRLVTGKTPFRGASVKDILRAQVKDEAEPANKANPDVPVEIAAIIQKLMAKEPALRFQTANDLLEELGALLQPPAKKGLWIGLAAAAVVIAGGAIWWAVTKPKDKEIVEKYYDDPEKQKLADENKRLKTELREKDAALALRDARLAGGAGEDLAKLLDKVAVDHADTTAASEARQLAAKVRNDSQESTRKQQQLHTRVAEHVAAVKQASQAPQQAGDFPAALKALDTLPPADLRDDPELKRQLQEARDAIVAAARQRLQGLTTAVSNAAGGNDEAALAAAIEALTAATANPARWPPALKDELTATQTQIANARTTAAQLANAHGEALWQQYHGLFTGAQGVRPLLERFDHAGASAAATQFATTAAGSPAAARAADLAAAIAHAGLFATALERAIAAGTATLATNSGALQLTRWDRDGQTFLAVDAAKKPPKEQTIALANVTLEQWAALADQVSGAEPGSRECFLGLLALTTHTNAARAFLAKVKSDDDLSGTGAAGYPLNAGVFETLLRRLPEQDVAPWTKGMRAELQAGQRLAAGLRALSERRNLAAAGHLEKLLADHPHSLVVAALP
jgi:tRNA A-37 threonylcarbamoyl transferase component Bud32